MIEGRFLCTCLGLSVTCAATIFSLLEDMGVTDLNSEWTKGHLIWDEEEFSEVNKKSNHRFMASNLVQMPPGIFFKKKLDMLKPI